MKKLVVFSVVFALIVGGAFAADIGATVFGMVTVAEGNSDSDADPSSNGSMTRLRIEGSGQNGDGTFGAWIRLEPTGGTYGRDGDGTYNDEGIAGLAWWKPMNEFKLSIGGNPDGIWGKEGYAGWMFYQMPSDIGIVDPASVWGGGYFNPGYWMGLSKPKYRDAFFGGIGGQGLFMDIKPMDMLGINVFVPFIDAAGGTSEDIFKAAVAQLDFLLDFGNIALTFDLNGTEEPNIYVYFNLSSVENLDLSFGLGYHVSADSDVTKPIAIGLGAKYDVSSEFGLKARLLAEVAGKHGDAADPTFFGLDLLPYYALGSDLKAFFGLGLVMEMPDGGDSIMGWHFNPYLQVGGEWGPTFYAGLKIASYGYNGGTNDDSSINWAIPIGLQVSF